MMRLPLCAEYRRMTSEEKIALDQHVQAIAKILYADADKSQMTNLGEIEAGIRTQLQSNVSPQLGFFYHRNYRNNCRIRPHRKKYFRQLTLESEARSSPRRRSRYSGSHASVVHQSRCDMAVRPPIRTAPDR